MHPNSIWHGITDRLSKLGNNTSLPQSPKKPCSQKTFLATLDGRVVAFLAPAMRTCSRISHKQAGCKEHGSSHCG